MKFPFLFTMLTISVLFANAQQLSFSDSIKWTNNKQVLNYDYETVNVLNFDGAQVNSLNYLPIYFKKIDLNRNIIIKDIKLNNKQFETVNNFAELTNGLKVDHLPPAVYFMNIEVCGERHQLPFIIIE